jgi:hypothetical protein
MATTADKLKDLADRDRKLATQQLTDLATLAAAQADLSSGDFSKIPAAGAAPQPPASKLGSGYHAAQGALAEAAMNKRFEKERAAEAKKDQKSPNILQRIASFFRNITQKIKDFFNSKDKTVPKATATPKAAAAPSLADQVLKGAQAEATFRARAAQRKQAAEQAERPSVIRKILAFFYSSKKSATAPLIPAANRAGRPGPQT